MSSTDRTHLIVTGCFCGFLLICGITCSVLTYELVDTAVKVAFNNMEGFDNLMADHPDFQARTSYYHTSFWAFGIFYVIPGLIGLIACISKSRGTFVAHMVLSIISLVAMGIVSGLAMVVLVFVAEVPAPTCSAGDEQCVQALKIYRLGIAVLSFFVIGWVAELTGTILSGRYSCRSASYSGVIVHQGPTTQVHMQPVISDQFYDQAVLVHNVNY